MAIDSTAAASSSPWSTASKRYLVDLGGLKAWQWPEAGAEVASVTNRGKARRHPAQVPAEEEGRGL